MHAEPTTETLVHRQVSVPLAPARAFELFTANMTVYWPADHSIGTAPLAEVVVEPRTGGRWYERGVDGSECDWGRVGVWAPPSQLVLVWQIGADWTFDPELETEVEVTFVEEALDRTRVDLRHRHLERYGASVETMRDVFGSPNGWRGILARFREVSGGSGAGSGPPLYERSLDQFASVLGQMPATAWDAWSPCTEWTARDIVGHTIWGQQLVRAWATDTEPPSYRYMPGRERPGPLACTDPVAAWRAARADCSPVLDENSLAKEVETRAVGTTTIGEFLDNLIVDNTAHTWDLAMTAALEVCLDGDLVAHAQEYAEQHQDLVRGSGMFGEPLTPPESADAQTRMLAALGRRAW